ncbi:MAG: hypothetical protein ACLSWY_05065 [Ruthenibacterium lactatiformans]
MIHTVETAARLLELPAATLHAGDVAQVLGRLVPGDGSWLYRWDPNSTAGPNGGTVLAPAGMPAAGRWLLCHSGTVDARCFGVFGPDVPADDALDALMADGSVTRIVFGTDVNFTRRHMFTRGHVTLDFTGHTVTAQGVEHAKHNDPFGALFHFTGVPGDDVRTFPLAQPMRELYDVFEVPGAGGIPLYSWWQVSVNSLAGREEKEIDKLLCVTERIDESHVRVNYKMGWPLAGRVMPGGALNPLSASACRIWNSGATRAARRRARSRWPLSTRCGATCGTCGRGIPTGLCCCAATTPNTSPNGAVWPIP